MSCKNTPGNGFSEFVSRLRDLCGQEVRARGVELRGDWKTGI